MEDLFMSFVMWLIAKNPQVASLLVLMGTLRLVMKPVMSALQEVVDLTVTTKDNELLAKVLNSKWYKALSWLLDYVGSVKLPQAPEKK